MTSDALSISELSYHYRHRWSGRRLPALHPFSLTIPIGETFGFLGHNGAGKTTTIKNILHLVRPSSGAVHLFGRIHTEPESRRTLGYVPENPYFADYLRVKEAVKLGADLAGVPYRDVAARVGEVLEQVGLVARASASLRTLSKGLLQRVAIAQALVSRPRLLILDEPFSGLDPLGRREIRDIFEQQRAEGVTIFMASHILSDVEHLCDRVSIMVRGDLKGVFSLSELRKQSVSGVELCVSYLENDEKLWGAFRCAQHRRGDRLTLTFSETAEGHRGLAEAVRQGRYIHSFQPRERTLEELYLSLVDTAAAREEG